MIKISIARPANAKKISISWCVKKSAGGDIIERGKKLFKADVEAAMVYVTGIQRMLKSNGIKFTLETDICVWKNKYSTRSIQSLNLIMLFGIIEGDILSKKFQGTYHLLRKSRQ